MSYVAGEDGGNKRAVFDRDVLRVEAGWWPTVESSIVRDKDSSLDLQDDRAGTTIGSRDRGLGTNRKLRIKEGGRSRGGSHKGLKD